MQPVKTPTVELSFLLPHSQVLTFLFLHLKERDIRSTVPVSAAHKIMLTCPQRKQSNTHTHINISDLTHGIVNLLELLVSVSWLSQRLDHHFVNLREQLRERQEAGFLSSSSQVVFSFLQSHPSVAHLHYGLKHGDEDELDESDLGGGFGDLFSVHEGGYRQTLCLLPVTLMKEWRRERKFSATLHC